MADEQSHCFLDRLLAEEELDRVRSFLRQQNIYLPDDVLLAHIEKPSREKQCPFRYGFAGGAAYCANKCHLEELAKARTDEAGR